MPAWWCHNDLDCWKLIVDKWFTPEWIEKHDAGQQKHLLMGGPSHHQGNLSNSQYRARWVRISIFLLLSSILLDL
jgi:hypothetical protein